MKKVYKALLIALIWVCIFLLIVGGAALTKGDPNSSLLMFLFGLVLGYAGAQLTLLVVM